MHRWYTRDWMDYAAVKDNYTPAAERNAAPASIGRTAYSTQVTAVHDALEAAVQRQLMSDVPYGVLLSGGLDSSVISAIAKKYAAKRIETDNKADAWWPQLHSFAVGLKGAPDLIKAREVARHIGTVHHEINYTVQEGLDAVRDVIYFIETYDITTVRASTPMYLLARVIKSMGIKMVLSGEGADEVFGGYLYFHKAPTPQAFHEETVRKLSKLHLYDCLRANKSLAAWGVEGRVPFLDKEFLDVAMRINPAVKMCPGKEIEKKVVREAFADMLPQSVAWRQKEQFSDGVGYSWIDTLKAIMEDLHVHQWQPYEMSAKATATSAVEALQAIVAYLDRHSMEALHTSTQIIIAPGYEYKIVKAMVTNFHQPQSTLLLLVSAFVHGDWPKIYNYALAHDFRFLSYGDSSLLIP